MKKKPLVKSVMTPFPYSIDRNEPVEIAEKMMKEHEIRHLPVTEQGKLVGVITRQDVKRAMVFGQNAVSKEECLVKNICEEEPYIVDLYEPLENVVINMAEKHVTSALVVKKGKLVGIFTVADACRFLGKLLRSPFSSGNDDMAA